MADWKKYLKDKRVWAAGAVVAAIAAVAVIRNRGGGDAGGGAPVGSGANPAGFYQQAADTTGTDLSGFLSNWATAQDQAQKAGFQSIVDAIKGGGPAQNDEPPPTAPALVYSSDPQGKPIWALVNSPYGGWMTTNSQQQANTWASQYGGDDHTADFVDWTSWTKLKEKWNK